MDQDRYLHGRNMGKPLLLLHKLSADPPWLVNPPISRSVNTSNDGHFRTFFTFIFSSNILVLSYKHFCVLHRMIQIIRAYCFKSLQIIWNFDPSGLRSTDCFYAFRDVFQIDSLSWPFKNCFKTGALIPMHRDCQWWTSNCRSSTGGQAARGTHHRSSETAL